MVTTRSRSGPTDPHQPEAEAAVVPVEKSAGSISGRKRSRDYGEELKGLTPDRESGAGASPEAKRLRTANDDGEFEAAQSDGLDDGEIVETTVAGQPPADSPGNAAGQQTDPPPSTSISQPEPNTPQNPASVDQISQAQALVLEQGETADAVHREDQNAEVALDHATGAEAQPTGTPLAEAQEDAGQTRGADGRNQGIGLGLRTSFAKAPSKQPKAKIPMSVRSTVSFPMMNKEWNLDATKFDQLTCDSELNHAERFKPQFWKKWMQDNLEQIITVLQEDNDFAITSISRPVQQAKLVRNAMSTLLHPAGGILHGTKKDMHQARTVAQPVFDELTHKAIKKKIQQLLKAQEPETGEREEQKDEQEQDDDAAQGSDADESMDVEPGGLSSDEGAPPSPEELEHRRLYFPGSENYPVFCIHCVSVKHNSANCPELACQFCGSSDHTRYKCPTKQRCNKCRQLGHTKDKCREKIALAKEEMEPCAYCGSPHTEDQCIEIWKSFNPSEAEIKKVKVIPTFCYVCGAEGHYGPECGLASGGKDMDTGLSIWSSAIRDYYVDPNSTESAIAWVGLDPTRIQPGQNLAIRGQAKKQTHVYYVSSDDSDDGFIREPVQQKAPPRGNIQVNTNTRRPAPRRGGFSSLRGQESRRRQDQREFSPPPQPPLDIYHDYASWQPPLPPGPPPPVPAAYTFQGNSASLPTAPPGTLPPRPGNPGYRNVSGGSQNGSKRGRGRPRRGRS